MFTKAIESCDGNFCMSKHFPLVTTLNPGELVFNNGSTVLKTLLGSCVAVVVWHPELKIGGMCHYLLPELINKKSSLPSSNFADDVVRILKENVGEIGTDPADYWVGVYGGSNMFPELHEGCRLRTKSVTYNHKDCAGTSVSCRNCRAAYIETERHGFKISEADLGGNYCRIISLNTETGIVEVKANTQYVNSLAKLRSFQGVDWKNGTLD